MFTPPLLCAVHGRFDHFVNVAKGKLQVCDLPRKALVFLPQLLVFAGQFFNRFRLVLDAGRLVLYAHSKLPPTEEMKQSPLALFRFTLIRKLNPHSSAVGLYMKRIDEMIARKQQLFSEK